MLPIIWVLLVAAQSVFGAPSVLINQIPVNEARPSNALGGAFLVVDGGDSSVYTHNVVEVAKDLNKQSSKTSQDQSMSMALGVLNHLAYGTSGDACASANYNNEYADYLRTGNPAGMRRGLADVINTYIRVIDALASLATGNGAAKYSTGPRGGCAGGGRSFQFDAVWDSILASANANNSGLMNEAYCVSLRLKNALSDRSNYVSAAVTAALTPPVVNVISDASAAINIFFSALASGNPAAINGAAANAKVALSSALARNQ